MEDEKQHRLARAFLEQELGHRWVDMTTVLTVLSWLALVVVLAS